MDRRGIEGVSKKYRSDTGGSISWLTAQYL